MNFSASSFCFAPFGIARLSMKRCAPSFGGMSSNSIVSFPFASFASAVIVAMRLSVCTSTISTLEYVAVRKIELLELPVLHPLLDHILRLLDEIAFVSARLALRQHLFVPRVVLYIAQHVELLLEPVDDR